MNLNITMMDLTPCYVAFDRFLFRDVRFAIGSVGYIHTPKGSGEIYNIKSFLVPFLFRHNICLLAVPETPEHAIVGLSTIPIPTRIHVNLVMCPRGQIVDGAIQRHTPC